jgi:hypothetical protein
MISVQDRLRRFLRGMETGNESEIPMEQNDPLRNFVR